ncbi:hypothetical protein Abr02nite_56680 [Paractinoplanes brasiliensis]|nr:hypothetical protein Abr02nite_56680 [Actinoplanes brasiliensis]
MPLGQAAVAAFDVLKDGDATLRGIGLEEKAAADILDSKPAVILSLCGYVSLGLCGSARDQGKSAGDYSDGGGQNPS